MDTSESFKRELYSINEGNFEDIAVQLFHFQIQNNPVYRAYAEQITDIPSVKSFDAIPFMPISFFKSHDVRTGKWEPETMFSSSGTTGQQTSSHPLRSLSFYREHALRSFEYFFGPVEQYQFFALLPSYLERTGSSLVAMMEYFVEKSRSGSSAFYLHDYDRLVSDLKFTRMEGRKPVVWGVTFALLDLAERYQLDLGTCLVFETGGMKGRRKEITRAALHKTLRGNFGVDRVYSEYGMTELLSQAYTRGKNTFFCPPWMKIVARDITDPMEKGLLNATGGINVVDFANVDSVSFIETEDIGKVYDDGSFEILGRLDNSEVRGCNLLVE